MKLVFATHNKGKLQEARGILGAGYELLTPEQVGVMEEVEETGSTLRENSILKAQYLYDACGMDCFADDTGLEIDALDGAPGVYTARYAGEACNFDDNMDKVLRELAALPGCSRRAHFRCVVTLIRGGEIHCFDGLMDGVIALEKSGTKGFGYDPVFIPDQYPGQTLADMGEDAKNAISHRGQAMRLMAEYLASETQA